MPALTESNSKLSHKRCSNQQRVIQLKMKKTGLNFTHIGFLVLGTVIMIMTTYSDCIMFSLIHVKLAEYDHFIGHFWSKISGQKLLLNFLSQRKENFILLTIFDNLERGIILNEYYVLDSVAREFSFLIQDNMIRVEQLFWNCF